MNDFGRFLYALRKRQGWTQTELADKLGVTNQAVSKWENGDSFPDTGLLVPISELFGVSVDELLKGNTATARRTRTQRKNRRRPTAQRRTKKKQTAKRRLSLRRL